MTCTLSPPVERPGSIMNGLPNCPTTSAGGSWEYAVFTLSCFAPSNSYSWACSIWPIVFQATSRPHSLLRGSPNSSHHILRSSNFTVRLDLSCSRAAHLAAVQRGQRSYLAAATALPIVGELPRFMADRPGLLLDFRRCGPD